MAPLKEWAHVVQPNPQKVRKIQKKFLNFKICSEQDLDLFLKTHPKIAAIPEKVARLKKVLKSMPPELKCSDEEVLCLVDSGATINAAWIERHFPQYEDLVQPTEASMNGDGATTAGGQKLKNKGRCVVHGSSQGMDLNIAFKDMETEVPILSVRKMVKKGNDVNFEKGGWTIVHRTTGRTPKLYEHDGSTS